MLVARMLCSDPQCAEEVEILVEELDELDRAWCECGYGLVVTAVSETEVSSTHGSRPFALEPPG